MKQEQDESPEDEAIRNDVGYNLVSSGNEVREVFPHLRITKNYLRQLEKCH